jgi:hypothetical protein
MTYKARGPAPPGILSRTLYFRLSFSFIKYINYSAVIINYQIHEKINQWTEHDYFCYFPIHFGIHVTITIIWLYIYNYTLLIFYDLHLCFKRICTSHLIIQYSYKCALITIAILITDMVDTVPKSNTELGKHMELTHMNLLR